jgi:uncharacterized protein YlxW (UPF0749 family)
MYSLPILSIVLRKLPLQSEEKEQKPMLEIREIVKARRKFLENLKPEVRNAQKELNDLAREINRLLARKKAVPDEEDLIRITQFLQEANNAITKVGTEIRVGFVQ